MRLEEAIKSNKFKDLVHKAGVNLLYTAWWMRTQTNGFLKPYGLTHEQYNVLRILKGKHAEAMCVKDIASRLIEKNSNVPRIIDRLVLKKWVKRSPGSTDRRETLISLTNLGITTLDAATAFMEQQLSNLIGLTKEEAVQLNELLEKFRQTG